MAFVYYDQTITTPYDLVMAGLKQSAKAISLQQLGTYVSGMTGFPADVCHKIIVEALEMGMDLETIREVDEQLYYAVPPKPPSLPKHQKC
ncbi:hypothetical protein KR018_006099, partial [Drosophila ironensis]